MAQDADAGAKAFHRCPPCHDVGKDARIKLGPPLNGLDGRKAGTYPGYHYSQANKTSGIVWTEQTFRTYIRNPQGVIPGTKMAFPGLHNAKEIADLWAYLSQFDASGAK